MITKESLSELLKEYPQMLTVRDLIDMGLYTTRDSVYKTMIRNTAPPYVRISENKLRFLKPELIDWLACRSSS